MIVQIIHTNKLSWTTFFELTQDKWKDLFDFTDKEILDLDLAKKDLPRLAFITEQLRNEGFKIIPINSPLYPKTLKENLKTKSSPPIIYVKGNIKLLQEPAVAIVGSRKAGKQSLDFTDQIAKINAKKGKIIVSGFAKGCR